MKNMSFLIFNLFLLREQHGLIKVTISQRDVSNCNWVVLNKEAEQEDVLFHDNHPETGFILLPDSKVPLLVKLMKLYSGTESKFLNCIYWPFHSQQTSSRFEIYVLVMYPF